MDAIDRQWTCFLYFFFFWNKKITFTQVLSFVINNNLIDWASEGSDSTKFNLSSHVCQFLESTVLTDFNNFLETCQVVGSSQARGKSGEKRGNLP